MEKNDVANLVKVFQKATIACLLLLIFFAVYTFFFPQRPYCGFSSPAYDDIPHLVKVVSQKGFGLESDSCVHFPTGITITQSNAAGTSMVPKDKILFSCADSNLCSSGKQLSINSDSIVITQNVVATAVVCLNYDTGIYYVVLGNLPDSTRKFAESICGLN